MRKNFLKIYLRITKENHIDGHQMFTIFEEKIMNIDISVD